MMLTYYNELVACCYSRSWRILLLASCLLLLAFALMTSPFLRRCSRLDEAGMAFVKKKVYCFLAH